MRLIDADAMRKSVLDLPNCYNGFSDTYDKSCIIGLIDEQPTIEPERKKGRWERKYLRPGVYADTMWHCSVCDGVCRDEWANLYSHCPNCGASMSEGEQE